MFEASLSDLKTLADLAKAANTFATRGNGTSTKVCHALRSIYFGDDGVLPMLKDIEAGAKVDLDRRKRVLIDFNDGQWDVEKALETIDFGSLRNDLDLSLKTLKALMLIKGGKSGLRRLIQDEINFYGQRGVKPNRKVLRELIAGIEGLNRQIEDLEEKIRSVAKR